MDNDDHQKDHPWVPYAWIILFVLSTLIVLIALPHMRDAYRNSRMGDLIQRHRMQQQESVTQQTTSVLYAIPRATGSDFSFVSYSVPLLTPTRHAVVEALLAGPPQQALRDGAVTCIPRETKLRGLSVSHEIAFVDLSKEFLNPTVWEPDTYDARISQLTRTLTALQGIRDVVILVEGKPLSEFSGPR